MERTVFDDATLREIARHTRLLGLHKIVVILASAHEDIPQALGIDAPNVKLRGWARALLDRIEEGQFFESWDSTGVAAREIELAMARLAGTPANAERLAAIADLLSRPREGDLADWDRALMGLRRGAESNVPLPDGVRGRMADLLVSRPKVPRIRTRTQREIDEWEWAFWRKHDVEAETVAFEVLQLRETAAILREVTDGLDPVRNQAFEDWANAELDSYEPNPRPAIWPARPPVRLVRLAT